MNHICLLTGDKEWNEDQRPIPIEPTRKGIIKFINSQFIKTHPLIKLYAQKNNMIGCYLEPPVVKQLIMDRHKKLSADDRELLSLAQEVRNQGDRASSSLLASLIFTSEDFRFVEDHIHLRLTSSTLGPNRELPGYLLDFFRNENTLKRLRSVSQKRPLVLCDPFAGSGAMSFLVAEEIAKNLNIEYSIINNDFSAVAINDSYRVIREFAPKLYERYHRFITYTRQDGVELTSLSDHSVDVLFTLRALHELSSVQVKRFFTRARRLLAPNGCLFIVDVTRETSIVRKARRLLPLLGKFSAFMIGMEQYRKNGQYSSQFLKAVETGDPYLAQAGIRSYESGFLVEEIIELATSAGFSSNSLQGRYHYEPPIGGVAVSIYM